MLACGTPRAPRDQKLSKSERWCASVAYALSLRETATWLASGCKTLVFIFCLWLPPIGVPGTAELVRSRQDCVKKR